MNIPHHQFGSTTIAKVHHSEALRRMLVDPWLDAETIVIKPNWVSTDPGEFTDADTLRMLFEALDARIIVVESYCLGRAMNINTDGLSFSIGEKVVNWRGLLKGKGWDWLIENPGWDWFRDGEHWEHLKKEEQVFLDKYGFADLFEEFNVTYLNVTEEVWNGRTADPEDIKALVEAQFKPVHIEKLYGMVPKALYNLRGAAFISLARLKMYASFTMKNLFGMIPDPLRPWWHGPGHSMIAQSILDINKIYHALFNMFGICEAINTTALAHPEGAFEGVYSGKYNLEKGLGVVAFGRDLVALDTILLELSDPSKRRASRLVNRGQILLAQAEFGCPVDRDMIAEAKSKVFNWLSP